MSASNPKAGVIQMGAIFEVTEFSETYPLQDGGQRLEAALVARSGFRMILVCELVVTSSIYAPEDGIASDMLGPLAWYVEYDPIIVD